MQVARKVSAEFPFPSSRRPLRAVGRGSGEAVLTFDKGPA